MPNPDDITRNDRECLWHPFTWMPGYVGAEPLVITKAEGITLFTADGRKLMDGVSSMWLNVHGHGRREIVEAIAGQARKFAHVSVFGQTHAPAEELARRLVEVTPEGLNHVFYSDDGATSVEVALKLAFQSAHIRGETKRTKFVALRHAYHGDTIGSVSVGDIEHFHHTFGPLLFETYRAMSPGEFRHGSPEAEEAARDEGLADLQRIFEAHADEICAFILEPIVQGAAGMLVAAEGYLRSARALCDRYGIPMIADEVFVGFGRTGTMFACEHEGVTPDIVCLAKGITGGTLPLAATIATDKVYKPFLGDDSARCTFFHGHSYTANPVGCAAALASLDLFETDNTVAHVRDLEGIIEAQAPRFRALSHVADVRFKGLIFAVDLADDPTSDKGYDASKRAGQMVCAAAMKQGLLIRPLGDVVYLVPPLVTTADELTRMLDILYDAVTEVSV